MYQNVVYIDILIILNLYVTFFLIKASGIILHRKIKKKRLVLGTAIGGLVSLLILLPSVSYIFEIFMKIFFCLLIGFVVFGFNSPYTFIKNSLIFLIANFLFAGIMLFLWSFSAPMGMVYNNGYVYFNLPFTFIIISTCIAYAVIKIFRYIIDVKFNADKIYTVVIKNNKNQSILNAFSDSGNTLSDFYSGLPVIICNADSLDGILNENLKNFNYEKINYTGEETGFRILPYSTIGHHGLIPVFKPEQVEINSKPVSALIGITNQKINGEVDAVFNPKLLI